MTDFLTKQAELRQHADALRELVHQLFPVGSAVTWRTENSFTQSGKVTSFTGDRVRVIDDHMMWSLTITVADILRAQP